MVRPQLDPLPKAGSIQPRSFSDRFPGWASSGFARPAADPGTKSVQSHSPLDPRRAAGGEFHEMDGLEGSPRHFHSSLPFLLFPAPRAASFAVGLAFRMLLLLGFLHPIARDIQLDNYAVMHQPVDRR